MRKKYRICNLCQSTHSYPFGRHTPTHCSCGGKLRVATRQEWLSGLINQSFKAPPAKALATAALAFALIPLTTHASTPTFEQPVFPTDAYLSGCEVRQSVDDGTRIAECPEDGAVYVWDADGQVWINDAGSPLRAPHNWYVVR